MQNKFSPNIFNLSLSERGGADQFFETIYRISNHIVRKGRVNGTETEYNFV